MSKSSGTQRSSLPEYDWPEVNWESLQAHRRKRLDSVFERLDLDAVILTCSDNIRYFTQFRTTMAPELFNDQYGAVVSPNGDSSVWGFWLDLDPGNPSLKTAVGVPSWAPSIRLAEMWTKLYSSKIRGMKAKRVGVEHLPFQIHQKMQREMPGLELVSVFDELLEARAIKHAEEVKLLRNSARVGDAGARAAYETIREGITEHGVTAQISRAMFERGAEFIPHIVVVSGGSLNNMGCVATYTNNRELKEGDNVVLDIGIYGKGGYATDITRTVFVGRPSERLRECYSATLEAYKAGMRLAVPGNRAAAIDEAVCKVFRESGFPEPPYGCGHGIGLRVMEVPLVKGGSQLATDETVLQPGMVLCIEPETIVDGKSVKFEEVVLVTDSGPKQLSGSDSPLTY